MEQVDDWAKTEAISRECEKRGLPPVSDRKRESFYGNRRHLAGSGNSADHYERNQTVYPELYCQWEEEVKK